MMFRLTIPFHEVFRTKPTAWASRSWRRGAAAKQRHAGAVLIELLVSATLLIALISFVVPLAFRAGRLWQEARTYRLAINELSNQLEDLTVMNDEDRERTLADWTPDEQLLQVLPGAELKGEVIDDADGKRLRLSLQWQRPVEAAPLVLIGWIQPQAGGPNQ